MDPNETLKELRELLAKNPHPKPAWADAVRLDWFENFVLHDRERIAELFQALDVWLSKGGTLPLDWRGGVRIQAGGEAKP